MKLQKKKRRSRSDLTHPPYKRYLLRPKQGWIRIFRLFGLIVFWRLRSRLRHIAAATCHDASRSCRSVAKPSFNAKTVRPLEMFRFWPKCQADTEIGTETLGVKRPGPPKLVENADYLLRIRHLKARQRILHPCSMWNERKR